MESKEAAAFEAVKLVRDGMNIGLGTGSTASIAIKAIGDRIRLEGLQVNGVPSSEKSRILAELHGIPLIDLRELKQLDLTIDGADEVDSAMNLIKGGGGALVREKIVAAASIRMIVVCDSSKRVDKLGSFPLPVAVTPFGHLVTRQRLMKFCDTVNLRTNPQNSGSPFVTDDGLFIYDMHCGKIADPPDLEMKLKGIIGVVEVGLFINIANRVVYGFEDGSTETHPS